MAVALLCCNESDPHRKEWLVQTLESFLPWSLSKRVILSNQDGRVFGLSEAGMYDKVGRRIIFFYFFRELGMELGFHVVALPCRVQQVAMRKGQQEFVSGTY